MPQCKRSFLLNHGLVSNPLYQNYHQSFWHVSSAETHTHTHLLLTVPLDWPLSSNTSHLNTHTRSSKCGCTNFQASTGTRPWCKLPTGAPYCLYKLASPWQRHTKRDEMCYIKQWLWANCQEVGHTLSCSRARGLLSTQVGIFCWCCFKRVHKFIKHILKLQC